jgi:hypothetical protein
MPSEFRNVKPGHSQKARRDAASCGRLLCGTGVVVELADQGTVILPGGLGKVLDKAFHLLAGGVLKGRCAAKVDRISLD